MYQPFNQYLRGKIKPEKYRNISNLVSKKTNTMETFNLLSFFVYAEDVLKSFLILLSIDAEQ